MQKLNSYILQSSCRGGMQRVFEPDTAHSAHIHGYQHITISTFRVGYQHIHSAYNHVCTHTQYLIHSAATYITTYTCIAISETIYTNDHLWLNSDASSLTQPLQSETSQDHTCHAMCVCVCVCVCVCLMRMCVNCLN